MYDYHMLKCQLSTQYYMQPSCHLIIASKSEVKKSMAITNKLLQAIKGLLLLFVTLCLLLYCMRGHIALFNIFTPHSSLWPPHVTKMWATSLSAKFSLSFSSHYSCVNSLTSTSQPLSGGTLSTTPCNFCLAPPSGIINSSTSFRVVLNFPVGHSVITPPLYQNPIKYPTPLLIQHPYK